MACKVHKRIPLRRKLHILRALSNSNSAKRTILHIYKLKVALETIKREYENLLATRRECLSLLNQAQGNEDVKVEKVRDGAFVVRVKCEKEKGEGGEHKLVAILEAFDDMCLNVEKARVSCENGLSLEAIAVAVAEPVAQTLDVIHVTQALLKAIGKHTDAQNDSPNS